MHFVVNMANEKITRLLVEQNPSWKAPFQIGYKDRSVYPSIKRLLKEPQIISLCGLRRVGKTTIMKKLMEELLRENAPDSMLYFSFDDFAQTELFPVLDAFKELHGKEPKFLFFDEIQKVPNWAEKVKLLYDSGKYKMVISGSESLFLRKGSRESLAGRIYEFEIKGLSFREYLGFAGMLHMAKKPALYSVELRAELGKYILCGGFPELIGKQDTSLASLHVKSSIIEKIIFVDLPRIYPIENPSQLLSIFEIVSENPGMIIDFTSLSQELGISRQTLSKYFECLESAHLVVKLYNFSKNRITSEKKLRKFYPSFPPAMLWGGSDKARLGKLMETVCVLCSGAKFFWRDEHKNEVDIVLTDGGRLTPIEVKYQVSPRESSGLAQFCRKYKCRHALVVTEDTRGKKADFADVTYVPICEFLLQLG